MIITTNSLDRQGCISHLRDEQAVYLCGISMAHAYWSPDVDQAMSVFEVPKAMNIIMEYNSSHTEYLAGHNYTPCVSKGMRAQLVIGMITSISTERPYRLSCGYTKKTTVWLFAEGLSSSEYRFVEVTPEGLAALAKPSAPILKAQHLYDYAFKVGTLCSLETEPPDWKRIMHKVMPSGSCCAVSGNDMDRYFRFGKMYKPGVCFTDAPLDMRDEVV